MPDSYGIRTRSSEHRLDLSPGCLFLCVRLVVPLSDVPLAGGVLTAYEKSSAASVLLEPAFPSPFTTSTLLRFELTEPDRATLQIVNLSGRLLETLLDEENVYMESWVSRVGGILIEWEPEPYRWMINGLGVDALDRLWVQRGTEPAPIFDIFDMDGEHLLSAKFPREGYSWKFHIDHHGILAWEEDPESGTQKVYLLELPEM